MSGKEGGKFMEGQVCLFSSNSGIALNGPVSPSHACPESIGTWQTCWSSQTQDYSRNVGRWLSQCGFVRRSSVWPHALVLINTHPGWITLSQGTAGLSPVMKKTVPTFFPPAVLSLLLSVTFSIKRWAHKFNISKPYWGSTTAYVKKCWSL